MLRSLLLALVLPGNLPAARPNVVIILADDQGYGDLSCHGDPVLATPRLDRLAEESLELTNFHCGTTCTPTRSGLMTGRNANRSGTWHTSRPREGTPA